MCLKGKFLVLVLFLFFIPSGVFAQQKVEVSFFYSQTCPHCAQEEIFLNQLENEYPEIEVKRMVFSENAELLQNFYNNYKVPLGEHGLVPIIFVGEKYFLGFDESIGNNIKEFVMAKLEGHQNVPEKQDSEEGKIISLPILGKIDTEKYSLATTAVILGFFDGFNVCSLGALVLILGLVLALRKRKKIFLYGNIFIITTAFVYGLLIFVWHHIFSLLAGYLRVMEILIGGLGISGGFYFLKEFIRFKKYGPTCQVNAGAKITNKYFVKIQTLLSSSSNIFLILSAIFLFATIITIVEFPCSAAVPMVFAGILANSQLTSIEYIFYIALFIIFYMLDEIIVFLIAFSTMTIKIASSKFVTWITLVEAVVLFLMGAYYLFGFGF